MAYHELFSSWEDVQREFDMNEPEPDNVYYAYYDHAGWGCDGHADVFYRNGDRYYYAAGSHCSCYGLEGQWEPEEYSIETLRGQTERATYGFFHDQRDLILQVIGDR